MKTETNEETKFEDLMDEFSFIVPGIGDGHEEEEEGKTAEELAAEAEAKRKAEEAAAGEEEEEETAEEEEETEGGNPKPKEGEEEEEEEAAEEEEEEEAPTGKSGNFYKNLALKYIKDGTWSKDLALEDAEGNQIPIEELKELNEETFFAIQEQIKADEEEERKKNYLQISTLDDRRKTLVTIISEGGDLKEIFKSEKQVQQYLNPFDGLDLDDEAVQERVYLNSLMQFNKLDQEVAIEVVKKAKKEGALGDKVKTFTEDYTAKFDKFVEGKKEEILKQKQERKNELKEFKKALSEQYKGYELKDSLVRKLTDMATKETDEGFEIDSVYEKKMQDPIEAAELILFLNDKEAYLASKTKSAKKGEQMKTRKLVKMIPTKQATKAKEGGEQEDNVDDEFSFQVDLKK